MIEGWVPKNKEQAEGFKMGKSFVQGFTDKIKEQDAEIERLKDDKVLLGAQLVQSRQYVSIYTTEIERLREIVEDACKTFEHNGQHFYAQKYRKVAREAR